MRYESLIFDIDGTLWDSRALVAEGYNLQLQKEGLEHLSVTAEDLKPLFGKVMTEIADILFATIPVEDRYALLDRCMETENAHLFESECNIGYPKVKETLAELSKQHRLFIVSNSQSGYPQLCIDKLGLGDHIQGHLCFGDTGTSKGQTILKLMRDHDITSAIYVGDTQGDLEACREANIPFIFAGFGLGQPESWDYRVDRFEDLLELPL